MFLSCELNFTSVFMPVVLGQNVTHFLLFLCLSYFETLLYTKEIRMTLPCHRKVAQSDDLVDQHTVVVQNKERFCKSICMTGK